MRIWYTDHFVLPLPAGHRFPMAKYARLRERVAAIAPDLLAVPPAATDDEGARTRVPREDPLGLEHMARLLFGPQDYVLIATR